MNRWQHFYDLAATQLAAAFAATRNLDPAEKAAMAKRFANEAKAFADALKQVEEAAFEPVPAATKKEPTPPFVADEHPGAGRAPGVYPSAGSFE